MMNWLSAKQDLKFDSPASMVSSISNASNFSIMQKIVDYMKRRHLDGQNHSLTLTEILDELPKNNFDVTPKTKTWLSEALPNNPRLQLDDKGKYIFKPPYKIKGKKGLLALAQKYHTEAKGSILLSDLNECIPHADKILEEMANDKLLIVVPTQVNKRKDKSVFFNDIDMDFPVEEEFKALWRNVGVDHLDEKKIEEYLQKRGIDAMKDLTPKVQQAGLPKRKAVRKRGNAKMHNEHLVLEDYD
ncbi:hypothetical protein WR25_09681 isoform B [Diploscapter pachys]|uniref:TFIIE beta domain-containing protein n=1 Tax=Diploscapter pachys TaxID=2018661 RepID=A0A2A2K872_9BILA|nr:hypothetical protein WR25_09681 isoform A [Diploscapter pachys]PAV70110.1 hypothetical protein WR25_09681 isoform B [Diploscapter pachys]